MGRFCDCKRFCEASRKPICEFCGARPTTKQVPRFSLDQRSWMYTFTSFCDLCWEMNTERQRERVRERGERLALQDEKANKMLESVRKLDSTKLIPIRYAVHKLRAAQRSAQGATNDTSDCPSYPWFHRLVLKKLSEDLKIKKVRGRYMCNETRASAMDFKLWWDSQSLPYLRWLGRNVANTIQSSLGGTKTHVSTKSYQDRMGGQEDGNAKEQGRSFSHKYR